MQAMDFQEMTAVAKLADADWRTVRRFLAGEPMKARTKARVVKALREFSQKRKDRI
jgi:hypothetical protein